MVCAIFKPKQLDIVPFVLCICNFMDFIQITATSHEIHSQYTGQGLVLLENTELRDTEGNLISCALSGEPYATFTWKWKDGQTPGPEQYFSWFTTEIPSDPKLSVSSLGFANTITETQKREIKTRTIYALGTHTDDPSNTNQCDDVVLSFIWKPEGTPLLSINKDPFVISEDSTVQFTCQLTDTGNLEGQVRWVKNGNLQSESEYKTQTISIPVTKDIDGDKLQCYYYNAAGSGEYSDEVLVNVHWKPVKPSLSINKDPLVIEEDRTAQLRCQPTDKGNPEGQVRWIKNGNLQSESEYKTQTISIPVTKDIDGDIWWCYYHNSAGDGEYSDEFIVNVHWKPEKPLSSIHKDLFVIEEDSTAQLTCQLTDKGNPVGQARWIKNGNLQSESDYNTQQISISVTKDNSGDRWQCYYYNNVGSGKYSDEVMINVNWSPGDATLSADTQTPKLGDTLMFTCTGDRGNPSGLVLLYLHNLLVANTTSKQHTITGVNETHNGNWDCMFNNYLNNGTRSQNIQINVLCLPHVNIDYITYEFTSGYVHFNLKTKNAFAASTLEISVCSADDSPSCEVAESNIEQQSNLKESVGLPENSDGAVYNVTFTFADNYRYIITQHGIELKGTVVQNQVPVILAAMCGTLLIVAIVTIIALVYVFHWRNKATGTNFQSETSMHYVNVGSVGNTGDITHIPATQEYEDVNAAATTNGQSSKTENATYMDLDQNEIQQTRNRPAEVTVYQSLN